MFTSQKPYINFIGLSLFGLVFFMIDRILKILSLEGEIFFYKNSFLSFSVFLPENLWPYFYIFCFLIFLVIIFLIIKSIKNKSYLLFFAFLLITIGMFSNLMDRLKQGFVVDYLNFYFFYNNLADIFLFIGVLIIICHILKINKIKKSSVF